MRSYNARPNRRRRWPIILITILILALVGAGGAVLMIRRAYTQNLQPVNTAATADIAVAIPTGASLDQIANILKAKDVIRATWAFKQYVRSNELGDKLQAGTYKLRASQSVQDIVDTMVGGKVAVDLFTILPNQRLDQIRDAFIKGGFDAAAVDKALDPSLYIGNAALVDKPVGANLEGYLYPDSFQKTAATQPRTIVEASLNEMAKALTPDVRAGFAKQGLTTHQAITLASIIEREVESQADRNTVAQVFYKRIKQGMPLQSDVTYIYAATLTGQAPSPNIDSPYNTYLHTGLPPGPISNVTSSGLKAVINPSGTDYLYFVAGDDGKTYFSKTNAEHLKNVDEHCKKLCGR